MKILFTGFDPFGGEKINPAEEAIFRLPDMIGDTEIIKLELPTIFGRAGEILESAIEKYHPDAVVCVGQAGGRSAITPEAIAINMMSATIPDNGGQLKTHENITDGGNEAYFSTLPILEIKERLNECGIPSTISYHAGTFVCNYVMYTLLRLIETKYPNMRGGFVHVPYSTEQAKAKTTPVPSMEIATMTHALELIAETIAK